MLVSSRRRGRPGSRLRRAGARRRGEMRTCRSQDGQPGWRTCSWHVRCVWWVSGTRVVRTPSDVRPPVPAWRWQWKREWRGPGWACLRGAPGVRGCARGSRAWRMQLCCLQGPRMLHSRAAWCAVGGVRCARHRRTARHRAQRVRDRRRRGKRDGRQQRTARATRVPAPGADACLAAYVEGGGRAKEASLVSKDASQPTVKK